MSDGWWQQLLAACLAALIPVVVKVLNDLHERLGGAQTAPGTPEGPTPVPQHSTPPYTQPAGPTAPLTTREGDAP